MGLNDLSYLKTVSIDKQSYYSIVKQFRLGEANGLTGQPLDAGAQREVFVLYLLGVLLTDHMLFFGDEHRVAAPVVRVEGSDVEGFQVRDQPPAGFVLPPPEHEGQDAPRRRVDRIPEPPLVFLVADEAPLLVRLGIQRRINEMPYFNVDAMVAHIRVHGDHLGGLFFSVAMTVPLPMPRTLAVSRMPLPFMAMSSIWHLTPGS